MRTVKEVARLTGVSVRTLHYYDEIGLLEPAVCSEAGYRLYDDKALERLQQILFFREFEMPLKEIKSILDNPVLDRDKILRGQKRMLELKKERLECLLSSINHILKGEITMDFEVFHKNDLENMFESVIANMTGEQQQEIGERYGSIERYRDSFMQNASTKAAQENFQKVVEWYGDKESALKSSVNPDNPKIFQAYQNRIKEIQGRLAGMIGCDTASFEVKSVMGEYDYVTKQLYQLKDAKAFMLELAAAYKDKEQLGKVLDDQYGIGAAEYIAAAIEEFYRN